MQIFSPIKIGPLKLKNRVVMPAMHLHYGTDGYVNDRMIHFYTERAHGGVSLILVGGCLIDNAAGGGMLDISDDKFIPGLKRLADSIHEAGALIGAQLYHAGRYTHSMLIGRQPLSSSAGRSPLTGEVPQAMTLADIKATVKSFKMAAQRAREASLDAVEILGSAGYLISQFCSPATNCRDDEYGGSFENRMRFALEVTDAVRAGAGPNLAVIYRIAGNEFVDGGNTNEEAALIAQLLEKHGVDLFNVTGGWHETKVPQISMDLPRGGFAYLAQGIKEKIKIPVMACNRINHPLVAEKIVSQGQADLIGVARGLIADPEWVKKTAEDKFDQISLCIGCNQGCFDAVFARQAVSCLVNPRAGFEGKYPVTLPASRPKKIMVVGSGPAGLTFAKTAFQRGHNVSLYEQSSRLGGQIHLAASLPERREFLSLTTNLEAQIRAAGIQIVLEQRVTPQTIQYLKPDLVVLATGAAPIKPNFPGVDLPHVYQAWDLLDGHVPTIGQKVVVIGGGAVGVEAALYAAHIGALSPEELYFLFLNRAETPEVLFQKAARGPKEVTLVEMTDKIGADIGRTTSWIFRQNLKRAGVKLMNRVKALEVNQGELIVEKNGEPLAIPADTVILALGSRSDNKLYEAITGLGIEARLIGDAVKPAKAYSAVHEAFALALEV